MRFPTIEANAKIGTAKTAFVLALDIELESGLPFIAERHWHSEELQYGRYWPDGVAAILRTNLAQSVIIVGGPEERHPDIMRPDALKAIVLRRFGLDLANRIGTLISAPNTIGNLKAIAEWCHVNSQDHDDSFVACVYRQGLRTGIDLRIQGLDMPVVPLESVFLAESKDDKGRGIRRNDIYDTFGGGAYVSSIIAEMNGVADKLTRKYASFTDRLEQVRSVA